MSGRPADNGGVQGGKQSRPKNCAGGGEITTQRPKPTTTPGNPNLYKSSLLHHVQAFSFSISNDDGRTDQIRSLRSGGSLWRGPMEGAD